MIIKILISALIHANSITVQTYFQTSTATEWASPDECFKQGNNYFFNPVERKCAECSQELNEIADHSIYNKCKCSDGFIQIRNLTGRGGQSASTISCQKCPQGFIPSLNGDLCVKCMNSTGKYVIGIGSNETCSKKCLENEIVQVSIQLNSHNETAWVEKCIPCQGARIPDKGKRNCVPCNSAECLCKINKEFCDEIRLDSELAYAVPSVENNPYIQMAYLKDHLTVAGLECSLGDRQQCQQLANMCVLQDYARYIDGGACMMLDKMRQSQPSLVPSLYYESNEIFRENSIEAKFYLDPNFPNNNLDVFALVYTLNGTLLGEYPAYEGIFSYCGHPTRVLSQRFQIGVFIHEECKLGLKELIRWRKCSLNFLTEGTETLFFELFLRFQNFGGKPMIQQIPVINGNIRDVHQRTNQLTILQKDSHVMLTRRFFMLDVQEVGEKSKFLIRVPSEVWLVVNLVESREEQIYIPYLGIRYNNMFIEKDVMNNMLGVNFSQNSKTTKYLFESAFSLEYMSDSFGYHKTIEVTMATLCSLSAMLAAFKAYSWGRRAGKLIVDFLTFVKFILYGIEMIGDIFLIVMGITSIWLTYAFKLQKHLTYTPLSYNDEWSFVAYVISATALKAIAMIHMYISLTLVETFFIDWERPKVVLDVWSEGSKGAMTSDASSSLSLNGVETSYTAEKSNHKRIKQPIIWRTYLVANEWNELQAYRKTSVSLQMLAMMFLLEYLEFGNWAKLRPGFDLQELPGLYESRMSRFAIDLAFYTILLMAQLLVQVLIVERVSDHFRNFMDLCSIANISVLAMTHPLRGFYIHGRSVHGMADTDMHEMNKFLEREKENLCSLRGLENDSENQTFIVNMPLSFRERLQTISNIEKNSRGSVTEKVEASAQVHMRVNEFLKDVINHGDPNCSYTVQDARLMDKLFGADFADTSKVGAFVRDPSEIAYTETFIYGNEWTCVSFEALLFCLLSMSTRNRICAAFVTYSISTVIRRIGKVFFTNNLIKSSQVDNRFLI